VEVRLISKPPGHYKDERGREYYWDGRQRSYIPKSSYDRMNEDLSRGPSQQQVKEFSQGCLIMIVGSVVLLPMIFIAPGFMYLFFIALILLGIIGFIIWLIANAL
jgi:hypothetical protein